MQLLVDNMAQVLGITLIHSLWQGLIVYLALRILLFCFSSLSSDKKYYCSLVALFAIATVFIYTFVAEVSVYNWQPAISVDYVPVSNPMDLTGQVAYTGYAHLTKAVSSLSLNTIFKASLPYIASLYLIGLVINLIRIGMAWSKIQTIKQSLWDAQYLQAKVDAFSGQFNIAQKVRVSFSRLIDVPCVVGYLKPIILLPVTLTTQLSAEEVESILLHELSHIKNNDYVLNLAQQMVSVLLFFNPLAQLISREISVERENRCDDWVVSKTGKPITYASALVKLEETRYEGVRLALAASGKKYFLRTRIERILNTRQSTKNMWHWLLLLLFICSVVFWFALKTTSKTAFNLSGKISGGVDSVSLYYPNEQGAWMTEKSIVKEDGSFSFSGHINGSRLVYLNAFKDKNKRTDANFFIGTGTITVTGDYAALKYLTVKGSAAQDDYRDYQLQTAAINQGAAALIEEWQQLSRQMRKVKEQSKNENQLSAMDNQMEEINNKLMPYRGQLESNTRAYIATHTKSYVSALQLAIYAKGWPVNAVKTLFNNFDDEIKNSSYGKAVSRIILEIEGNPPGSMAADFTAKEDNGKLVSLNDMKGKVVMLNFWTSAQPGLDNTPHLITIYKKYHQKGFDIIGIADDDADPDAWKRYLKKTGVDHLWHQVLRGVNYSNGRADVSNAIDNKFSVNVLPTRILIGRDGKIIGRYIGTEGNEELDKQLSALFD